MKKIILGVVWILFLTPLISSASHIVGGEIEFYPTNRSTNRFYLGLNLYFDQANANAAAETNTIRLYFFRKSDNQAMGGIELPKTTRKLISYSNPVCGNNSGDLQTLLLRYSSEVILNAQNFDDARGYYIVWERCCRNRVISNIQNPANTGETFYTEFPALIQNGQPYTNSSPKFEELKGDYICLNRPFTFDFSGKDADGDSLVYSLTKPWAGYSSSSNPEPVARGSSAYPEVEWVAGINNQNMIPGNPSLFINPQTGMLGVTASRLGLYVFAVLIEEYRKGVRIGAVRREFQLKVVDCPQNASPVALFREAGKINFYKKGELLTIKRDQSKCLDIMITDGDANQRLSIKTIGVNFDDKSVTVNPVTYTTKSTTDTLKAQICFEKCLESRNNTPLVVAIVVSDDGCPQPRTDTLSLRVFIEGNANNNPEASTDLANNRASIPQGTNLAFKVTGADKDNDDLILEAKGRGFELNQVGMSFSNGTGKGTITQPFNWNPPCNALDREYVVDFIVTDVGCNRQVKDTVTVRLQAFARANNKPSVSTNLPANQLINVPYPTSEGDNTISFEVYGDDLDKADQLKLYAQGKGFNLSQYSLKFDAKNGLPRLTSRFDWTLTCSQFADLAGKDLVINFICEDNSCGPVKTDTMAVTLRMANIPDVQIVESKIPNVITPNNDGKNDCFTVDGISDVACGPQFLQVDIYNRWGKLVFSSTDKKFKWCADGVTTGTYFYGLRFTDKTIKGTLTVVK